MGSYSVWIVASRPYAEKAMGTATTTSVEDCQEECPSLFFYSEEEADSYRAKLDPELGKSFKTYPAVIRLNPNFSQEEQLHKLLGVLAIQKEEEIDLLSEDVLRSRLKTLIAAGKMIQKGAGVFDVDGKDSSKTVEIYRKLENCSSCPKKCSHCDSPLFVTEKSFLWCPSCNWSNDDDTETS